MRKLIRSRTFWAGVAAIATGIVMIYDGELKEGVAIIFGGLGMIFMRDALPEKEKGNEKNISVEADRKSKRGARTRRNRD
jgi:hypothetical protein